MTEPITDEELHGYRDRIDAQMEFYGHLRGQDEVNARFIARIDSRESVLREIRKAGHHWCRWGHGPEHDLDTRRGDGLCSCGKVQRDAAIDRVLGEPEYSDKYPFRQEDVQ